jgi:hypothetical protein
VYVLLKATQKYKIIDYNPKLYVSHLGFTKKIIIINFPRLTASLEFPMGAVMPPCFRTRRYYLSNVIKVFG